MIRRQLVLSIAVAAAAFAQAKITNGKLEQRALSGSLDAEVRRIVAQGGIQWIGYSVPIIPGERNMCDYHWGPNGRSAGGPTGTVYLEGPREFHILIRTEAGRVAKLRSFTPNCELDAGGTTVTWLTGVNPSASVAFLSTLTGDKDLMNHVVTAIAFHNDSAADGALAKLVEPSQPEEVRKKVTFWLGNARGAQGYRTLLRVLKEDPSERVRESVTFALSQSKEPEALKTLIETAKSDPNEKVRGQALFWLAQKAGKEAVSAIRGAIENDPDLKVKERAVFALSQLKSEGVPMLIEVARTNKSPEIRKKAMFWLGQSKDPRALKFFEEMLSR
jgi:hypothetical protein